jgi:hypothetical protein
MISNKASLHGALDFLFGFAFQQLTVQNCSDRFESAEYRVRAAADKECRRLRA